MKACFITSTKTFIWFYVLFPISCAKVLANRQQCGFPGTPAFGYVRPDKDLYTSGSVVRYSCRVGYILLGSPINRCDDSGEWTEDIPICDDSMTSLGRAFSTATSPGHPEDMAIDRNKETCTYLQKANPRWWRVDLGGNFKVLSVAITMISPERYVKFTVSVIKLHGTNFMEETSWRRCASFAGKFGTSTIVLSCAEGKGLEGQRVHIEDHMNMDGLFDICEVEVQVEKDTGYDCGRPNRNPHSITFDPENNKVQYGCQVGYKLDGPLTRTCLSSGQWSGEAPVCNAIICDKLDPLENGHLRLSMLNEDEDVLEGTVVNYDCDRGFKRIGDDSRICRRNGSWSGSAPTCEAIRCAIPDGRKLGGVYGLVNHTTRMGSMALLKCWKGKREGDNPFIVCTEEGDWTEPQARCLTPARVATAVADGPRIAKKPAVILGMVVAPLMITTVLVSLFMVMKRRRDANKPEIPSRQSEHPEAPPRPPPRTKGGLAASIVDCIGRATRDSVNENEPSWKTRSLPQNRDAVVDSLKVRAVSFEQSLHGTDSKTNSPVDVEPQVNEEIEETEEDSDDAQSNEEKESSVKDTDESRSPTPKAATTGVPYAAVDYEKKRESRLLKDVNNKEDVKGKPGTGDRTPPSLPPKENVDGKFGRRARPGTSENVDTKENQESKLSESQADGTNEDKPSEPAAESEDKPSEPAAESEDKPSEPAAESEDKPSEPAAESEDKPSEPAAESEDKPSEPAAESEEKTAKRTRRVRGQIDVQPEEKEDQKPSWRRTRAK